QAGAAPGHVSAVAALEHDAFDRNVARIQAEVFELFEALGFNQLRNVEPFRIEAGGEALQALAPAFPGELAQVLAAFEQYVVEPDECRVGAQHLATDVLPPEPLLKRVEACGGTAVDVRDPF